MLRTDITMLEQRRKVLAKEIDEALSHAPIDDPMIAYLKSRIYTSRKKLIVCVTKQLFRIIDSLIYHHSRLSCEKCGPRPISKTENLLEQLRAGHSVA